MFKNIFKFTFGIMLGLIFSLSFVILAKITVSSVYSDSNGIMISGRYNTSLCRELRLTNISTLLNGDISIQLEDIGKKVSCSRFEKWIKYPNARGHNIIVNGRKFCYKFSSYSPCD